MEDKCVICELINDKSRVIYDDEYAVAISDGFPVSQGHTLIVPKRHIESIFDATDVELKSIYSLIIAVRNFLEMRLEHKPDGYNIGINEGRAAGRTVDHTHIHIIPRYKGDVEDPRGGIRGVIPDKKIY